MRSPSFFLVLSLLVSACGESSSPSVTRQIAVHEGTIADYLRPEVGLLWSAKQICTATLIRPRMILSAAHCFEYRHGTDPNYFFFEMRLPGRTLVYHVIDWRVALVSDPPPAKNANIADQDIGVGILEPAALQSGVTPAPTDATEPALGEPVSFWGYGCQEQEKATGPDGELDYLPIPGKGLDGHVRQVSFAYKNPFLGRERPTTYGCLGDSGGPLFDARGNVVLTLSKAGESDEFAPFYKYEKSLKAIEDSIKTVSAADCYLDGDQATDQPSMTHGVTGLYYRGIGGTTCWGCGIPSSGDHAAGWWRADSTARCGILPSTTGCPIIPFSQGTHFATDQIWPGHSASIGEYAHGTDGLTCWRCGSKTKAGARQAGNWFGGDPHTICNLLREL